MKALILVIPVLVSACASNTSPVATTQNIAKTDTAQIKKEERSNYVSPLVYDKYDCKMLIDESGRVKDAISTKNSESLKKSIDNIQSIPLYSSNKYVNQMRNAEYDRKESEKKAAESKDEDEIATLRGQSKAIGTQMDYKGCKK